MKKNSIKKEEEKFASEIMHEELDIVYENEIAQGFGNNNHAIRYSDFSAEEREKAATKGRKKKDKMDTPARRERSIMRENADMRNKLNRKLNNLHNYGEDARSTPLW